MVAGELAEQIEEPGVDWSSELTADTWLGWRCARTEPREVLGAVRSDSPSVRERNRRPKNGALPSICDVDGRRSSVGLLSLGSGGTGCCSDGKSELASRRNLGVEATRARNNLDDPVALVVGAMLYDCTSYRTSVGDTIA